MSKKCKFEAEEQEFLDSYERGDWQSMDRLQEKIQQYQGYAIATLEKKGLVSIILPPEDIKAIQHKASEAGMSYQTLIAKIVHQFVSGCLVEKS